MNLFLRPFTEEDQEFLFRLYASTREGEIASFGWDAEQQEMFLRMQFNARQRWYETAYSGADHQLILDQNQPVGRILVLAEDEANLLVDIALLSEYRGRGIGTQLLRDLIAKSERQGRAVRLQVLKSNPARRLYERLGFVQTGEDDMYYQMKTLPKSPELP
jgi:ribosomal protein S18 acetylase RimI-like enzyme